MKLVGIVLLVILAIAPAVLLGGFIWMICLGALGHIFNNNSLCISYGHSIVVALIAGLLLGGFSRALSKD